MGRSPLALLLALSLVIPSGAGAAPEARRGKAAKAAPRAPKVKPRAPAKAKARPAAKRTAAARPARAHRRAPTLPEAKAALTALMRDRTRRRFHHHWDRAIAGLLAAARGRDRAAATLEAARARYALYRWSANEADREKALLLAARAERYGARDARSFALAIRREAGDDRPARAPRPSRGAPPAPPAEAEEEAPPDPALENALADLSAAGGHALPLGSDGGAGPAKVSEVRTWSSDDYTRVAVYLSHWVGWSKFELQPAPDRPRRIALDFRPAVLEGAASARAVPGAQVDRVRAAQNAPDTVRVVLDLPGADVVQAFALDDPPRLVLDVGTRANVEVAEAGAAGSATATATAASTSTPTPTPTPTPTATSTATSTATATATAGAPAGGELPSPRESGERGGGEGTAAPVRDEDSDEPRGAVRRIVVDAGHGGHDPGAIGPRGVREKTVTLAIARRLAKKLRGEGFEVVLTRSNDRYLALEERTAIANTARGDLFVSIHANAHPRRNRSGVESWVLNVADDRYASRLAARENGLDLDGEGEAARILTDLDAKASAGASGRLARLVQREVTTGIRARVGDVRDLGVKSALFYVLLGARMPAVLVETGFISNRAEERRLASSRYQDEVAAGIARAVSGFARSTQHVAAR